MVSRRFSRGETTPASQASPDKGDGSEVNQLSFARQNHLKQLPKMKPKVLKLICAVLTNYSRRDKRELAWKRAFYRLNHVVTIISGSEASGSQHEYIRENPTNYIILYAILTWEYLYS